jgi:adenine/guanine phosphoribosyltransferase-like PRPP-binding protein
MISLENKWSNQIEKYVKLGLFILSNNHKTLQDFTLWLNKAVYSFINLNNHLNNEKELFELTSPTLSRYLSDKIGISKDRGLIFYEIIKEELEIKKILQKKILEFSKDNWKSINTRIILTDINFLTFIVIQKILLSNYNYSTIDAVITPEADGIPLGVIFAQQLRCKCIYVRKNKRSEDKEYVQVEVQRFRNVINYYLSLNELPINSKVLLVDDICRSGSTLQHLEDLIKKAGSKVVKKLVLINIVNKDAINNIESFIDLP